MADTARPWLKAYPPGVDWAFKAIEKPVYTLLDEGAASYAGRRCIDFMGKTCTYADVARLAKDFAAALQHHGIQKGDRVGLCLPNCPFYVMAYYGVLKAGATVVNFNPLYTQDEITHQVEDSGIKLMVSLNLRQILPKVSACVGHGNLEKVVVCDFTKALPFTLKWAFRLLKRANLAPLPKGGAHVWLEAFMDNSHPLKTPAIDPLKDIAVVQYTGGTTGRPKGAMLSHSNVISNVYQVRQLLSSLDPAGERFLCVLPFFHVFAMTGTMNLPLLLGAQMVLLPKFDMKPFLSTIKRTRPTIFAGVPTLFGALNTSELAKKYDLRCIKYCVSGGAGLPTEVKKAFEQTTGCTIVEGYGLSETSPVVTLNPLHTGGRPGSIGLALPGTEVQIRDIDTPGKVLATGETGELVCRGPQVMAGYWNHPEETAATFVGGWFRTGDVGHMDADGYVFLTDRLKELINCSGFKVYPRNIEAALYKHPAVAEAVVIGIPHGYKGEAPKAFVTLKPGAAPVTSDELLAFANKSLNPIERPVALEIRTELPKTLIGKLSKKMLADEEAAKAAAPAAKEKQ